MELGLLLIFWYGILHAFGPDHLTAIADFSIGKSKKKTLFITMAFAIGHGVMLFLFAKILEYYHLPEHITEYGDMISSIVILSMGLYILFMVFTNRIQLKIHNHNGKDHIHIWFGKNHEHDNSATASAFTIGALMGIGGVRGMLVTLGLIEGQSVDLLLILMFVLGVSVVFVSLGVIILYINQNLLNNLQNIRRVFATVGIISVIVGSNMLFTPHSHAVMINPTIEGLENHQHPHMQDGTFQDADALVKSKTKSNMTYRQMMQQMGESYKMIQTGIITQNKELIKTGVFLIDSHPAPKEKPWSIVKKEDQATFKKSLLSYDTLLHDATSKILSSLETNDWSDINKASFNLSNQCISCHSVWKNNLK
jgi:cytochrome c biogenesis protein CcdA